MGPNGSKQRFADFVLPEDLKALGGNAAEEYPDYLGQCASLDENLGKLVEKLKEKGLYENTVILYASDHGSHFKTRNRDAHLNGYDDYKRSCHDGCLHSSPTAENAAFIRLLSPSIWMRMIKIGLSLISLLSVIRIN